MSYMKLKCGDICKVLSKCLTSCKLLVRNRCRSWWPWRGCFVCHCHHPLSKAWDTPTQAESPGPVSSGSLEKLKAGSVSGTKDLRCGVRITHGSLCIETDSGKLKEKPSEEATWPQNGWKARTRKVAVLTATLGLCSLLSLPLWPRRLHPDGTCKYGPPLEQGLPAT